MRALLRLLFLLVVGCAVTPRPQAPGLARIAADIGPFVTRYLEQMQIPGACVAVLDIDPATGRQACWAEGYGQWRGEGTAMPFDAVFRVGSISKLFTATAVMRLVEQGRLDL